MFAVKVAGNVKGQREAKLGQCTLLVGRNASGKSAILDTLALALRAEPLSAGVGKRPNEILAMAPSASKGIVAEVELSNGQVVQWACTGTTARAQRPTWSIDAPVASFVVDEAVALLTAAPKAFRAALVARLGLALPVAHARKLLPEAYWPILMASTGLSEDAEAWQSEQLFAAHEELDRAQRAATAAAKDVRGALEAETDPLSEAEAEELAALTAQSVLCGMSAEAIMGLRDAVSTAEQQLALLGPPADIESLPEVTYEERAFIDLARTIRALQTWALARMTGRGDAAMRCPCCGREGATREAFLAHAERLTQAEQMLREKVAAWNAAKALVTQKLDLETRIRSLHSQLSSATLEQPIDRVRLLALRGRAQATEAKVRALEIVAGAEQKVEALKSIRKTWGKLLAEVLDTPLAGLSQAITRALPPGHTAQVQLRDGAREVCRVTMDGQDVRALSGAERATLLAGLAWAVAEPAELQLLVIDDVWFDRETLDGLLTALEPTVTGHELRQAIVCAVEYDGAPPPGWLRVDV